ncbi:hypothetical protein NX059_010567 [Plenodomus lindquistii]|nr:hypothetical protein NX059_010567 [Plenodomus lindquistii]
MGRHANPDIRRAYAEFQDTDTPSKCNKVRCLHCGYVRAKNTTRQIEHLQECQAYLATPEAQAHVLAQQQQQQQQQEQLAQNGAAPGQPGLAPAPSQILNGQHPNPNLQVNRRGPHSKRGRDGQPIAPNVPIAPHFTPSLTSHLLAICSGPFAHATQQPFLSHAGCGSLAVGPCSQWLAQDAHMARGYIRFIGQLLAKMRLPNTQNSQFHPMYRTMDLLISALNNTRREMQFFEITATKYGLALGAEPPSPITRAILDMFVSASSTSASLLEGMVALWSTQHCYRSAWQYAHSFSTSLSTPSNESHIVALHQALIPNWTSPAFSKFVDATRSLVDELANITTTRDGKEEMQRCEEIFRQICWLQQRFWPDVDGMGEETESSRMNAPSMAPMAPDMRGPMSHGNGMQGPPNMGGMSNMNNSMNVPMRGPMQGPMHNGPMSGPVNNGPLGAPRSNSGPMNQGPMTNGPMNAPMNNGPLNAPRNNSENSADNENNDNDNDEEDEEDEEDDNSNGFGLQSGNGGLDSVGQGS